MTAPLIQVRHERRGSVTILTAPLGGPYLTLTDDEYHELAAITAAEQAARIAGLEARLAAVRDLALSLGDRSGPADARPAGLHAGAPGWRDRLPVSDRRLMEPLKRMLLAILDGES